ncbi:MAG: DUF547 domain-containing protein [Flavobacteriales bacterium]
MGQHRGFLFLILLAGTLLGGGRSPSGSEHSPSPEKDAWERLLSDHVTDRGFVDYKGLKQDPSLLDKAIAQLKEEKPSKGAPRKERLAFWINAYNAFAIQLVLDHYPIESIRDIDRAFKRSFIRIDGAKYSLNSIEKGILLKEFDDPRIHYAVNCASISCPPLRGEPYRASELDEQLRDQAITFVNDPSKNRLKKDRVRISKIYDWYKGDFTKNGSLIGHLNEYAKDVRIEGEASIAYMEYDWGLNQKSR